MRKIWCFIILVAVVFTAGCTQDISGLECSFAEVDFSKVAQITLFNGENGQNTQITNADDIAEICKFLRPVTGTNGVSGKGYYGYSYSLRMCDADGTELYSITFSEGALFYGNDFADGYPTRYVLTSPTTDAVKDFFLRYDTTVT